MNFALNTLASSLDIAMKGAPSPLELLIVVVIIVSLACIFFPVRAPAVEVYELTDTAYENAPRSDTAGSETSWFDGWSLYQSLAWGEFGCVWPWYMDCHYSACLCMDAQTRSKAAFVEDGCNESGNCLREGVQTCDGHL